MVDTCSILAGMHARLNQLRKIAKGAHNVEIEKAVLVVAADLTAEIERLEAESQSDADESLLGKTA